MTPRRDGDGTLRVGVVGTFDVSNFGDLLFPLLATDALRERLGDVEVVPYSYSAMAEERWHYATRSLGQLVADLPGLDLVVVGGGQLIRFDRIADGFGPADAGIHDPTGLWLMPSLLGAARGVPVAWNAPGVSAGIPAWGEPLVRAALRSAARVAVRDRDSAERLGPLAASGHVPVVPDSGFGIDALVPSAPSDAYAAFLRDSGLPERYVVVQPSRQMLPIRQEIDRFLTRARERDPELGILELPISLHMGDRPGRLDLRVPTTSVPDFGHPALAAEILSRAQAAIGVSFHFGLVAAAAGVPVARPASPPGEKYTVLEALEDVTVWRPGEPAELRIGRGEPGADVRERAAQVSAHWDAIAGLAGRGTAGPAEPAVELFVELPGLLERSAAELQATAAFARELEGLHAAQRDELVDASRRLSAREQELAEARIAADVAQRELRAQMSRRPVRVALRLAEIARRLSGERS